MAAPHASKHRRGSDGPRTRAAMVPDCTRRYCAAVRVGGRQTRRDALGIQPGYRFILRTNEANHTVGSMLVSKFVEAFTVGLGVWQNNRNP